jgi:hypothetical protein
VNGYNGEDGSGEKGCNSPQPSKLNGLHSGAGFVSGYASGAKVSATSEELEVVQVCPRQLVEGYGYSMSHVVDFDDHAIRYEQSVGVTTNDAAQFSGPTKVGALE